MHCKVCACVFTEDRDYQSHVADYPHAVAYPQKEPSLGFGPFQLYGKRFYCRLPQIQQAVLVWVYSGVRGQPIAMKRYGKSVMRHHIIRIQTIIQFY